MINFVDDIVGVLLGKKASCMRQMLWSSEHVFRIRASVRHEHPGRFIVLAVCDRRCIAAKRDEAYRRLVAGLDLERPNAVERVELRVKRVASVFGGEQLMLVCESEVIEGI